MFLVKLTHLNWSQVTGSNSDKGFHEIPLHEWKSRKQQKGEKLGRMLTWNFDQVNRIKGLPCIMLLLATRKFMLSEIPQDIQRFPLPIKCFPSCSNYVPKLAGNEWLALSTLLRPKESCQIGKLGTSLQFGSNIFLIYIL